LAGEHQWLGVQALAPGGRFLEIGKMDVYGNSKLGLMALRKNASFVAIDLDRLQLVCMWGVLTEGLSSFCGKLMHTYRRVLSLCPIL
jgi:hypothetical protein